MADTGSGLGLHRILFTLDMLCQYQLIFSSCNQCCAVLIPTLSISLKSQYLAVSVISFLLPVELPSFPGCIPQLKSNTFMAMNPSWHVYFSLVIQLLTNRVSFLTHHPYTGVCTQQNCTALTHTEATASGRA